MTGTEELMQARLDIRTLQVQVETLTQGLDDLRVSNQQLQEKVDKVLLTLSEAKGGWKTLMIVGGASTTLGTGFGWLLQHFGK